MSIAPRYWAAWPMLLAAGVVFAQVVSLRGLLIGLGVGVAVTWWVTSTALTLAVTLPRRLLALGIGGLLTVTFAGLTEWLGGTNEGPLTRSALVACGLAVAMVLLLATRWPMLCLIPGSALVYVGLDLGGAGAALTAVGVIAVAVAVTAVMVGPYRGSNLRDSAHLPAMALVLLVVGLGGVAVALAVWVAVPSGGGSADLLAVASALLAPDQASSVVAPTEPLSPVEAMPWWMWALVALAAAALVVLVFVLLVLLVGILRRLVCACRWRLLRRRLRRGTAVDRVAGAWTWARLRRARYDVAWPVSASPDVIAAQASRAGDATVEVLARLATAAAFDPDASVSMPDSARAWGLADAVGARPASGSLNARWRWAARRPSQARRLLDQVIRPEARPQA